MKLFSRRIFLVIVIILSLWTWSPLSAQTGLVFTSPKSEEELKKAVVDAITRTDRRFREEDETLGFSYHLHSRWLSPYNYSIYIGRISSKIPTTILRIEGSTGHVYTFARILEMENAVPIGNIPGYPSGDSYYENLGFKYHGISQGLNLIAPWASVFYQGYGSPTMSKGTMWSRFFFYFAMDVILVSAAGTDFYRQSWEPEKFKDRIGIALAIPRVIGMYQTMNATRAHNRVAELKYTFPID